VSERRNLIAFYSWQSDLANATNRGLIEKALINVARTIRQDDTLAVEPVIDRDTSGVAGAPAIADTIFQKIDAADIFVADVTPVTTVEFGGGARHLPNPNVGIELGYAIKAKGWSRIILVLNAHFGRVEDLPFDLRGRRAIRYRSSPSDNDRASVRKELERDLEAA